MTIFISFLSYALLVNSSKNENKYWHNGKKISWGS